VKLQEVVDYTKEKKFRSYPRPAAGPEKRAPVNKQASRVKGEVLQEEGSERI
jgi:hypothetical protein